MKTPQKIKPILYILFVPSITPEGSGPQSFTQHGYYMCLNLTH